MAAAVRRATPEDAAAIARVHVLGWQAAYAHVFPEEALASLDVERRREQWTGWIEAADTRVLAGLLDGEVVGFASVGASRDDDAAESGELYAIYVRPDAWGSGVGPSLMEAALDALRELGFREATLWVLDDNPRARRFYERTGWATDGAEKPDEFFGVAIREVRYRRRL